MTKQRINLAVPIANRETPILTRILYVIVMAVLVGVSACNSEPESGEIGEDDIGGVVTGPNGPEAGVWVIAETHDLPTRFAKIVVTDDDGRYLIPDLPSANYAVGCVATDLWIRQRKKPNQE